MVLHPSQSTSTYYHSTFLFLLGAFLSFLFFLAALIYKIKEIGIAFSNKTYLFNIFVYMVTVIGITYHYLIKPILIMPDTSLLTVIFTIGYQMTDLGILFFSIVLYYLIQFKREKRVLIFLVTGFLLQVTADSVLAYLAITESYRAGNIVDLMWIVALILVGFTGFYSTGDRTVESTKPANLSNQKEFFLPYASIIILIILVFSSYQWYFNALSVSLLFTFFMVIARQLLIITKNNKLVGELRDLAYHDPLTGLPNRFNFKETIEMTMETNNNSFALLLIDLDSGE